MSNANHISVLFASTVHVEERAPISHRALLDISKCKHVVILLDFYMFEDFSKKFVCVLVNVSEIINNLHFEQ